LPCSLFATCWLFALGDALGNAAGRSIGTSRLVSTGTTCSKRADRRRIHNLYRDLPCFFCAKLPGSCGSGGRRPHILGLGGIPGRLEPLYSSFVFIGWIGYSAGWFRTCLGFFVGCMYDNSE